MEELILQYEKDFFDCRFCSSIDNLKSRLAEEYIEFGSSGKVYNRDITISSLLQLTKNKEIYILGFMVTVLSETVLMANYFSYDRVKRTHAARTSIWKQTNGQWKIYFHQGTPIEQGAPFSNGMMRERKK